MAGKDQIIKTNPKVLIWARESLFLSKQAASERCKISLDRLNELEKGNCFPTFEEIRQLSKTYNRTISTLLLKSPPAEKQLPQDFRTVNSEQIGLFHEKTIIAIRKARAFAKSLLELKQEAGISTPIFKHRATLQDAPSLVAKKYRELWQFALIGDTATHEEALETYIEFVESLGVAVFQLSLTQDGVRGFSLVDEPIPVIAIKRGNEPPTAKIFTLFHEVGHLLLNQGGICDIGLNPNALLIEQWCNAFAGEILAPGNQLLDEPLVLEYATRKLKEWKKKDIEELVAEFHIGPLAMLRRLKDLGLTTNDFYNSKHQQWNRPSFGFSKNHEGRNIPKETLKERGQLYVRLAFQAFDHNKIDLKDLSDFLGLKLSEIQETRQLLTTL